MAYQGLITFVKELEKRNELRRIKNFADPVLEIAEITDRIVKSGEGNALLFEDTGTGFPLLINTFGSESRISTALGREDISAAVDEIKTLMTGMASMRAGLLSKISALPGLLDIAAIMPSYIRSRGQCQEVVNKDPDLNILPVLQCWPYDGGRFVTLPMVHTIHPENGQMNVGMYRMQILDRNTTGMHWQRHKTGANHYEAWKKRGQKMPVSVALGGDPVYTYAATAPLPENINEYILAGFLRKKKVKLVKCLTNDIYVPSDADIVIEGYVDPSEDLVCEGPFGDHTGFYSLADWYPRFHVTCITHSRQAIYPATIVGIPPQEDAWLALATEKIFLTPVRMALAPEVKDFHMPVAGTAHNLMVVSIDKIFPGQGMKVISSLTGTGQMMFSKYVVVVDSEVDIRDYRNLLRYIFRNTDLSRDILFSRGPLDVLDHASDTFSFGGKAGIDATAKLPEESAGKSCRLYDPGALMNISRKMAGLGIITGYNSDLADEGIPVLILSADIKADNTSVEKVKRFLLDNLAEDSMALILMVDNTVDLKDLFMVSWQVLGNTDPLRDHDNIKSSLFIDATIKAYREGGFSRNWPNVVCSDLSTINAVDKKWDLLGLGKFIESPSLKYMKLCREGRDMLE